MDIDALTTGQKTFLIAPAGYGKTYTIAASVKHLESTEGKSLVLTHTHAGVSSLKTKMREMGVSGDQYSIETISSFCQKYTNAFYRGSKMPAMTDRGYHDFIVAEACEILRLPAIGQVIQATYERVFVDEYQDCSARQHELVIALSAWIMTHVLGDPLQGIFGAINKSSVNFPDDLISNGFSALPELDTPHRWLKNGHNNALGNQLRTIRASLLSGKSIDLGNVNGAIEVYLEKTANRFNPQKNYWKKIWELKDQESVLLLLPEGFKSSSTSARVRVAQCFRRQFSVLEAIDDKSFYGIAKSIDQLLQNFEYDLFKRGVLTELFGKTSVNEWFTDKKIKNRRGKNEKASAALIQCFETMEQAPSPNNIHAFLVALDKGLKLKIFRHELFQSIIKSLDSSSQEKTTVFEAMKNHRNNVRRSGRKCIGRFVGTTLLTKGLEFDVVVILDAHLFECPKHLYVAMTRACKRLIVFTENKVLLGKTS